MILCRSERARIVNAPCLTIFSLIGTLVLLNFLPNVIGTAYAQTTPPITSSGGLGTKVIDPITVGGHTQYDISGGTRPGGGTNLFHSFGEFGVPTNNIANFFNGVSFDLNGTPFEAGLQTSNILARVTGTNGNNPTLSSIYGTIQTTGFGNANLFLMNSAGFLFGPDATVNVGGLVAFTSADYLKLTDNTRFNAISNAAADALLTALPVATFGFLGSNPRAITVQGSQFSVTDGQSISLVGGNISIESGTPEGGTTQPARLSAPGGQINLAGVASPGEVQASTYLPQPGMTMGTINLSQGSTLDVSADAAGTVRIRGGEFVIADATLSADTGNANGAPVAIDISLTGDLSITDTRGVSAMTARTSGTDNAGEVLISSGNFTATTSAFTESPSVLIDTHTSGDGSGSGGNVNITTSNLNVAGSGGLWFFIDSGTQGTGRGGDTTISGQTIELRSAQISTGTLLAEISGQEVSGSAGNLTITSDSLRTNDAHLNTSAAFPAEQSGDVTMNARDINMLNSTVSASGFVGGGITINADTLIADATRLQTFTELALGGGITFQGRILELTNGSSMSTGTFGDGPAGDIRITATDHFNLIGITGPNPLGEFNPSGLFSNSFGFFGTQGSSGNIVVTTPRLAMGEGRINTSTATSGHGGNVAINASTVEISGEFPNTFGTEIFFTITDVHPSGIFTQTVGTDFCAGPCGDAGNITANVGSLIMGAGSQIDSGTTNNGQGGSITINTTNTISMSGTLSNGDPVGVFSRSIGTDPDADSGGNINLTAGQSVTISAGASISASSTGPGNAGNISIDAGNQLLLQNSSITTQASQASGGKIYIRAVELVHLVNGTISTSVLNGEGGGGDLFIDPNSVLLQNNSQILAQAIQGAGGNITITTPLFLADQTSLVSASSQFGLNGTVTIQSPTSNLSGSLGPLASKPSQAQSLLTQRCAALANGQASSFVVAGREQLPADPGGWLTSPLAFAGLDADPFKDGTVAEGTSNFAPRTSGLLAHDRVSLRRLTPAGFLIANFADSEATGCHS